MNEDFNSQAWVDSRARHGEGIGDVVRDILVAFERLAALQYAAPWAIERRHGQARCASNTDCL